MIRYLPLFALAALASLSLDIGPARALDTRGVAPKHAVLTVTGTAQLIAPAANDYGFRSFRCVNEHASEILYIGGSNVSTSSYGTSIGASQADGKAVGADGFGEYVVSDGSSVSLHCRFYD
jgi:hypothetical protein